MHRSVGRSVNGCPFLTEAARPRRHPAGAGNVRLAKQKVESDRPRITRPSPDSTTTSAGDAFDPHLASMRPDPDPPGPPSARTT